MAKKQNPKAGEPGWITIWRGWEKLNTLVQGANLAFKLKKCG